MTKPRNPDDETVQIILSGMPQDLLRWYDHESFRLNYKRSGKGGGRSGLIVKALEFYQKEQKRRRLQNKERKGKVGEEATA